MSFARYGRESKQEPFLDQMNQVVPWSELLALVEPFYPKAGNGRQPAGLAIMLRTCFLQQWFSLLDPGMEEAFYESPVLRRFAGSRSRCGIIRGGLSFYVGGHHRRDSFRHYRWPRGALDRSHQPIWPGARLASRTW